MADDFYHQLGVTPRATQEEIARAFRQLALHHHPDVGGDAAIMAELNRAYEVLGDPVSRQVYDDRLELQALQEHDTFAAGVHAAQPPRGESTAPGAPGTAPAQDHPATHVAAQPRWALGLLRGLLRLSDAVALLLWRVLASDSLPWLIGYFLVLLAIAIAVKSLADRLWGL
ncbi:MAG: J domain-containing protein [Candidatus Riflebacteria bacterium]|nr:J domain-containing protein [Candidatus Riflebacteria bacterium]